jgi:integrase/recombinase XerC
VSTELAQSWAQLIDRYMLAETAAGRPPTTLKLRRGQLEYIGRDIGCSPTELTADHLMAWFGQQTAWKIETRRTYRSTVQSFVRWAHKKGHIPHPLDDALPGIRQPKASPRPAPDTAWQAALAIATPRVRLMMRLAAEAGLRRAEVAQVAVLDLIDTPGAPQLLVHGKGAKDRVIPISGSLADAIRAGVPGHTPGAQASQWLFPVGRGHLAPISVGILVSEVLPDHWTMHTLRHRFATRVYRGSRNLRAVQTLLGHASVATTERYTAVDDDEVRAAMMSALDPEPAP